MLLIRARVLFSCKAETFNRYIASGSANLRYPQQAAFATAEDKSKSTEVICSPALWKGNHSVGPFHFQMLIAFV